MWSNTHTEQFLIIIDVPTHLWMNLYLNFKSGIYHNLLFTNILSNNVRKVNIFAWKLGLAGERSPGHSLCFTRSLDRKTTSKHATGCPAGDDYGKSLLSPILVSSCVFSRKCSTSIMNSLRTAYWHHLRVRLIFLVPNWTKYLQLGLQFPTTF